MTRVVVITGATGATGRAAAAALSARGDTVVAVGTDAARLATVDAADRRVADLTDRAACDRLAAEVLAAHGRVDGLLHLVGGWRAGSDPADAEWLTARLVTTLMNVSDAFEPSLLAAPAGRLAIVSSTVVHRDAPPTSAYAAAKLAAEDWMAHLTTRWAGTDAAAVTFVVRSIEEGAPAAPAGGTSVATLAAALIGLWDRSANELAGARLRI
ncbi:SDR family NAD(P)-dependent oxidoreductase [Lysinimonas soli]|uniref:SDR family NAD(P)-dependent oxidoreductase n=1 Tax=Lysinimonas soli TaxID=1074233 RepID=A0ABW0NNR2_9MICO